MTKPNHEIARQRKSMKSVELTADRVRELFDFDVESGALVWRVNPRFTRGKVGSVAGNLRKDGYVGVLIDGKSYLAHRIAWLHLNGAWPINFIDHINGNRADNRPSNLRNATNSENMQNQRRARVDNKSSGLMGVQQVSAADGRKWKAKIVIKGKPMFLGRFTNAEEAHQTYLSAKRKLHKFCSI